jgi:hypothetical protein
MYLNQTGTAKFIEGSNGAYLSSGGVWVNVSDKNLKENIQPVEQNDMLNKINQLKISSWNYTREGNNVKHIGPMAEEFYQLFNVGNDNKSISTIDPAGISLVGIQALSRQNAELKTMVSNQNDKILELQNKIEQLSKEFDNLNKSR